MKNKTIALWLTLVLGPLGLHRLYVWGRYDGLARWLPLPTLLGLYGVYRARSIGLDDLFSWFLIPLLGFTMAACALNALVYGLMDTEKWNQRFNPGQSAEAAAGQTNWLTVAGLVAALFLGATVLLASLAFCFQHYFEYQADQVQQQSLLMPHGPVIKKSAG